MLLIDSSDGNGEIDMSEFIVAGMHLSQLQRRDKAKWKKKTKLAFDSLDKDKDGFISVNELREELQNLSGSQTSELSSSQTTTDSLDDQLEEVIKEADKDGNGKIDYEEFCQLLRSKSSGTWKVN